MHLRAGCPLNLFKRKNPRNFKRKQKLGVNFEVAKGYPNQ